MGQDRICVRGDEPSVNASHFLTGWTAVSYFFFLYILHPFFVSCLLSSFFNHLLSFFLPFVRPFFPFLSFFILTEYYVDSGLYYWSVLLLFCISLLCFELWVRRTTVTPNVWHMLHYLATRYIAEWRVKLRESIYYAIEAAERRHPQFVITVLPTFCNEWRHCNIAPDRHIWQSDKYVCLSGFGADDARVTTGAEWRMTSHWLGCGSHARRRRPASCRQYSGQEPECASSSLWFTQRCCE